jgi:hypothetical protein
VSIKKRSPRKVLSRTLEHEELMYKPSLSAASANAQAFELAETLSTNQQGREILSQAAYSQVLEHVKSSGMYDAANRYVQAQRRLHHTDEQSECFLDCILATRVEFEPWLQGQYVVLPSPRTLIKRASLPFELLHRLICGSSRGTAVWLLWYLDDASNLFAVAIASDSCGINAGWVIGGTKWLPIMAVDFGLKHLLKHHRGKYELEEEAVRILLRTFGASTKATLDIDGSAFQNVYEIVCSLQTEVLKRVLIPGDRSLMKRQLILALTSKKASVEGST